MEPAFLPAIALLAYGIFGYGRLAVWGLRHAGDEPGLRRRRQLIAGLSAVICLLLASVLAWLLSP